MTNETSPTEENCKICDAFSYFKYLILEEVPVEDAFHSVFADLAEDLIEDVIEVVSEESFEDGKIEGYKEGYSDSLREIAKQAVKTADIVDSYGEECTCDENEGCTDCPTTPSNSLKCGDCECEEECEIDVEIRRAMWEDI